MKLTKSIELLIVTVENEKPSNARVMILDDHIFHMTKHLFYFWKPKMISHIINHYKSYRTFKKLGLPKVSVDSVVKRTLTKR